MSEMGLLGLANAQVLSLRAGNPAADTCLRTNSSSSPKCEYGASTQFVCVFPVIRREILRSASRSKKKDGLLGGRSKQIASLKTQAERGAGHLGDEQVALGEPVHIARKYFLRRHAPVGLPSIVADQVACEHFMTQRLQNL